VFSFGYTLDPGHPKVGQTVAVVADASGHTWTSGSPGTADGTFDSGDISNGFNYQYVFSQPGTYAFFCRYHYASRGMYASITVDPA
jgi:plastocyanin